MASFKFTIKVVAGSNSDKVGGVRQDQAGKDCLVVKVRAKAVGGAANTAVVQIIAKTFDIAKRDVAILSGHTAKIKRIEITGDAQAIAVKHNMLCL